jgi:hypothetical protein
MSLPYDPAIPRLRSREAAELPASGERQASAFAAPLTNAPLPKADGSMADNPADHAPMAHGSVADGPEALPKGPIADGWSWACEIQWPDAIRWPALRRSGDDTL